MEKYVFECYFEDTPKCEWCMLSKNTGEHRNCMALGIRPRCPEEGCRKDCPLKKIEWTTTEQSTEQSAGQSTEQPTERPIDRFNTISSPPISSPPISSPIPATPILKGQDLVGLVDGLRGLDKGGARRERARKLLEEVANGDIEKVNKKGGFSVLKLKCTACGSELKLEVAFTGCDWETEKGKGSGYKWPVSLKCPNPDCRLIYTIGHVKNYGDFVGMADEYKCVK